MFLYVYIGVINREIGDTADTGGKRRMLRRGSKVMQKILGVDAVEGKGLVIRDTETGEVRTLDEEGKSVEVGKVELGENVIFESEGDCPRCAEVKELVVDLGLSEKVKFYPAAMIAMHLLREDIMTELSMQNMELPIGVIAGEVVGLEAMVEKLVGMCDDQGPVTAENFDFGLDD